MPNHTRKRLFFGLTALIYSVLSIWLIVALNKTLDDAKLQMKEMTRSFLIDVVNTQFEFDTLKRQVNKTLTAPSAQNLSASISNQQQLASRTSLLMNSLTRLSVPDSMQAAYIEELTQFDSLIRDLGTLLNNSTPSSQEYSAEAENLLQQLEYNVSFLFTEGSELLNHKANQQIKVLNTLSTTLSVLAASVLAMFAGLSLALRKVYQQKTVLQKLATEDALTLLRNRRSFNEIFSLEFARTKRTDGQLSFLMLDVDHFKLFNDTYGHARGDEALVRVAEVLRHSMKRQGDWAFRLGGEEFGCLMSTENKSDAQDMAERILADVINLNIVHNTNQDVGVLTISIGIAQLPNAEISTESDFYRVADEALYLAKKSGKNRFCIGA